MNVPENSLFFKDQNGKCLYKSYKSVDCIEPSTFYDIKENSTSKSKVVDNYKQEDTTTSRSRTDDIKCCYNPCLCMNSISNPYLSPCCSKQTSPCSNPISQLSYFPTTSFPACDIVIPPAVPNDRKMPRSILACGVAESAMKPEHGNPYAVIPHVHVPCKATNCGEPCVESGDGSQGITQVFCCHPNSSINLNSQIFYPKSHKSHPYCPSPCKQSLCSSVSNCPCV